MAAQVIDVLLCRRDHTAQVELIHQSKQTVPIVQHGELLVINSQCRQLQFSFLCSDFTFETLDYWSVGVLKDSSELDLTHHSTTPSPILYLHGLGSNGFTPISNKAGPGCARARPKAGCKSPGRSMRSP